MFASSRHSPPVSGQWVASNRNQVRLSASSIQFSIRLALD
jgi:hypothetical protein